jgi:hypothetical protein
MDNLKKEKNKIEKNRIFSNLFFKFGNARYNKFEEISKIYKNHFNNNYMFNDYYYDRIKNSKSNEFRKNKNNLILNDIDYLNNKLLYNNNKENEEMRKNNNLEYLYKLYSGDGSYKNIFSTQIIQNTNLNNDENINSNSNNINNFKKHNKNFPTFNLGQNRKKKDFLFTEENNRIFHNKNKQYVLLKNLNSNNKKLLKKSGISYTDLTKKIPMISGNELDKRYDIYEMRDKMKLNKPVFKV